MRSTVYLSDRELTAADKRRARTVDASEREECSLEARNLRTVLVVRWLAYYLPESLGKLM